MKEDEKVRHLECVGEMGNMSETKNFDHKTLKAREFGRPMRRWGDNIKIDFKKCVRRYLLNLLGFGLGEVAGCFVHVNEYSIPIKTGDL
jgi:hypothetical protein